METKAIFDIDSSKIIEPKYFIGTDAYDKDVAAYCLVRRIGTSSDIILSKTMKNDNKFSLEVKNLTKYFNAILIKGS